jgi:hypothetical protein
MAGNWGNPRSKEWLVNHPVANKIDVEFLLREENVFCTAVMSYKNKRKMVQHRRLCNGGLMAHGCTFITALAMTSARLLCRS